MCAGEDYENFQNQAFRSIWTKVHFKKIGQSLELYNQETELSDGCTNQ